MSVAAAPPAKKAPRRRAKPSPALASTFPGTILDAMDLAGMTGPSWAAWRVFWKAVFALPMEPHELELYQRHTGRTVPPSAPVQEVWQPIGRRGGKSRNAGLAGVFVAIRRDYSTGLAPGERAVIPIIAASRKQAAQVMRYIKGIIALPAFEPYIIRALTQSVEFTTGVTLEITTASYRTSRGYTIVGCICDEIAFWRSEDSAEPDSEILDALRPGMATVPDSLLLGLSTPYARKGELYRATREFYGKEDPHVLVWNADTLAMHHSTRLADFVAEEFRKDPVVAASEYGIDGHVTFRTDVETFLQPEALDAVTMRDVRERLPETDENGTLLQRYVAFTDPSGGSQDSWTLCIAHRNADQRAVLDVARERRPPFSPDDVVSEFAALLGAYRVRLVEGDHYGGEFPRELFRQRGITYRVSALPKSDLYKEVLAPINAGRVQMLDDARLRTQLLGLERRVARSGQDSIDHAPGGRDDVANAAAGALVLAARHLPVQSVRFAL